MGPHQGERRREPAPRRPDPHAAVQGRTRSSPRDAVLPVCRLLQARGLHGGPPLRGCAPGPRADQSAGEQAPPGDRGQAESRGSHGPRNHVGSGCRGGCGPGRCPAPQKVSAVQQAWRALPTNGKPRVRPNGLREWTVVAGVLVGDKVVAVASGVKAVVSKPGVVADMHAEILALRALSRYVVDNSITELDTVELVVSHTPCGDASMSAITWDHDTLREVAPGLVKGRSAPHMLGVLRTKPGRADSPATLSKSCSDKLALRQVNGCLASWAGCQAYISNLYTPVTSDFERCFGRWSDRVVSPLDWHDTTGTAWDQAEGDVPCTTSVVWTAAGPHHPGRLEILCNGIRQGAKKGTDAAVSVFAAPQTKIHTKTQTGAPTADTTAPDPESAPTKWYPNGWMRTYISI